MLVSPMDLKAPVFFCVFLFACVAGIAADDAFGFAAPSFADRAHIEAMAPAPGADDEHLGHPLLMFPTLRLPTRVLEVSPEYPNISMLREGENLLREALWLGLPTAEEALPACQNATFGPKPSSDPHCVDWCLGPFQSPGTWGFNFCCPFNMCYFAPTFWAPIGYCWTCENTTPKGPAPPPSPRPSPPPPYKASIDCVAAAQALDNHDKSPCRINGGVGAGSFDKKAPVVMNETCIQLQGELQASRPPSKECCTELVKFVKAGCTCDSNLARLAHDFAGTDYDTFRAVGRVTQLQCGAGQVFDPCRNHYGTCFDWSYEPSAGLRPNN